MVFVSNSDFWPGFVSGHFFGCSSDQEVVFDKDSRFGLVARMASSTQGAMIVVVKNRGKYNDKTYFLPTSEQANSSRVNDLGSVARGALH